MTDKKSYSRTASQKIQDEVRNKVLHQNIAWGQYRANCLRELLPETKENENGQ